MEEQPPKTLTLRVAEALPKDVGRGLARLKIPVRRLVVNRVVSSEQGACAFCHERWPRGARVAPGV